MPRSSICAAVRKPAEGSILNRPVPVGARQYFAVDTAVGGRLDRLRGRSAWIAVVKRALGELASRQGGRPRTIWNLSVWTPGRLRCALQHLERRGRRRWASLHRSHPVAEPLPFVLRKGEPRAAPSVPFPNHEETGSPEMASDTARPGRRSPRVAGTLLNTRPTYQELARTGGAAEQQHASLLERTREKEDALRQREERHRLAWRRERSAAWDWHVPSGEVTWNEEHFRCWAMNPTRFLPAMRRAERVTPRRPLGDREAGARERWRRAVSIERVRRASCRRTVRLDLRLVGRTRARCIGAAASPVRGSCSTSPSVSESRGTTPRYETARGESRDSRPLQCGARTDASWRPMPPPRGIRYSPRGAVVALDPRSSRSR